MYAISGEGLEFLVQLSGASYTFDWDRPGGAADRAVHTLDPERRYRVALEGHVPERGQGRSMFLSGHRETLPYRITDVPFRAALYAHAVRMWMDRGNCSRGVCGPSEDREAGPHPPAPSPPCGEGGVCLELSRRLGRLGPVVAVGRLRREVWRKM